MSVITEGEALGHGVMIDSTTLASVVECTSQYAGGLKVKMNHYSGADAIVGMLRNFRVDGSQVRADLQLLKSSPMRPLILEMSAEMPESFGLSISFSGTVEELEKVQFVRCLEIYSCDIVDQPAANPSGLFSVPTVDTSARAMDIATLTSERDAARVQAQTNFASFTEQAALVTNLTAERDDLAAKFAKVSTEFSALAESNTQLTASLAEAQKLSAPEVINAAVNRALAATGHAPISAEVIAEPASTDKPKVELTGLARARAAFAAQIRK